MPYAQIWKILIHARFEELSAYQTKYQNKYSCIQRYPDWAKNGATILPSNILPSQMDPESPKMQRCPNIGEKVSQLLH